MIKPFLPYLPLIKAYNGTSLGLQCLRLCTSTAGGTGSMPGQGTKILHAEWHSPYKKSKLYHI